MEDLTESIFPSGIPSSGYSLRLEFVGSWESQFVGLSRLTAFLTPRLLSEAHGFDDMGLNVVFLQRHRVEVGLKLVLERAGANVEPTHKIPVLRAACADACRRVGFKENWDAFLRSQGEFIDLLDRADPEAATYRYPVDRKLQPLVRGPVDLVALERAGATFHESTIELIDQLATLESVPIEEADAVEAAKELQALIHGCREMMRGAHHNISELRKQTQALGLRPGRFRTSQKADIALDAIGEVAESLADRASKMLDRIESEFELSLDELPPQAELTSIPSVVPFDPSQDLRETQNAQIEAFVDNLIATMRPLAVATNHAYRRSQGWSKPVARQLHLDIALFRSRLSLAEAVEAH